MSASVGVALIIYCLLLFVAEKAGAIVREDCATTEGRNACVHPSMHAARERVTMFAFLSILHSDTLTINSLR